MTGEYDELHAKYYDLIYQKLPGEEQTLREIGLIERILRQYNTRPSYGVLLDIACGTGRHLLPLLSRGYAVEGIDSSPYMLLELKKKAEARGIALPQLHSGDIKAFQLPEERYGGAYCFLNTFGEVAKSLSEGMTALSRIRSALLPEGWLLIDMDNPRRNFSHWVKILGGVYLDTEAEEHFEFERYDDVQGVMHFTDVLKVYEKGLLTVERKLHYSVKFWSADELRLLFMQAGFRDVRIIGDDQELGREPSKSQNFLILGRRS